MDARIVAQLNFARAPRCASAPPRFEVTQMLDYRPDQGTGFVNLAPAVLINYDDWRPPQLIQPGSRVTYAALFAGAPAAVARASATT